MPKKTGAASGPGKNYKRERIAAGEIFDRSILEQPKVPDDQNFYKTPLLQTVGYKRLEDRNERLST